MTNIIHATHVDYTWLCYVLTCYVLYILKKIVRTLEGEQLSLDDQKLKPGQSTAFGVTQAYDTNAYNADMLKFKKMVMSSQEFPTSEFGESTSEYGRCSTSSGSDANYHSDNAQKV